MAKKKASSSKKKTAAKKASAAKKTVKKKAVTKKKVVAKKKSPVKKKAAVKKAAAKNKAPASGLTGKTVAELRSLAKEAGIAGVAKMKKAELIAKLQGAGTAKKEVHKSTVRQKKARTLPASSKTVATAVAKRKAKTPFLNIPPRATSADGIESAAVEAKSNEPKPDVSTADRPLQDQYGRDFLYAMVRDPEWVYVYWEMAGNRLDDLRKEHSQAVIDAAPWVLRVKASGHGSHDDLVVGGTYGNWYVKVSPNARYDFELGLRISTGEFLQLAVTEGVYTPAISVSAVVDESWMIIRRDLERLMASLGDDMTMPGVGGAARGSGLVHRQQTRVDVPRAIAYFSASLVRLPSSSDNSTNGN